MNIDKMLGSIIGNKKTSNKSKIGASLHFQKMWKKMSPAKKQVMRSKFPDSDGDRVPDRFDCQPRNPMRQDGRRRGFYTGRVGGKDDDSRILQKIRNPFFSYSDERVEQYEPPNKGAIIAMAIKKRQREKEEKEMFQQGIIDKLNSKFTEWKNYEE